MSEQQQQQQQPAAAEGTAPSVNATVDDLGGCKKLVRVEVPVERVDATFDEITGQFVKVAQLPGFRPGKVPKHLVVKSFADRIQADSKKKLLEESFRAASEQLNLRVIVTLNLEEQNFGRGMPFQYNVTCEIAPEFTVPEYKALPVRREIAVASESDVERAVNILREQHVKYLDVTRAAQQGDVVVVNYTATTEGKPLTDLAPTALGLTEKKGFWLAIATDSFIPGFTEQLVGASAGDKRTVNITFPADFVASELSNRPAAYDVEITLVKEKFLPVVNEEFAKGFGANSIEELLAGVRRDLQNELDSRQRASVREQILKSLLDAVQFDLPESLLTSETRNLVYNIVNQNQQRGVSPEVIEQKKDEIYASANASAKDRVKAGMILNRIATLENIGVDQREVGQRIVAIAQERKEAPEKVAKRLKEQNGIQDLAHDILTSKVLDFLELNAKVEEVPVGRV